MQPCITIVLIGRNSRGNWVAHQQHGLYGGLFVSRAAAVRYALFENGNNPEAIVAVSREIELDMRSRPLQPPRWVRDGVCNEFRPAAAGFDLSPNISGLCGKFLSSRSELGPSRHSDQVRLIM